MTTDKIDTSDPKRRIAGVSLVSGQFDAQSSSGVRKLVTQSERKFNVKTLPPDMLRVYRSLAESYGDDYGLLFVFTMRTAIELHRAWHMTLLTNKILQGVKDKFGLRMTWNLGVIRLKFRVEDGGFELHRKVRVDRIPRQLAVPPTILSSLATFCIHSPLLPFAGPLRL